MDFSLFPPVMGMLFEHPFPVLPMSLREEVTTLLRSRPSGQYTTGVHFTMNATSIVVNFARPSRKALVQIPMYFKWSSATSPTVDEAMEAILLFSTMDPRKVFSVATHLIPSIMKPPGTAWMVTHPLVRPLLSFYSESLGRTVLVHHSDDSEAQECLEYLVKLWTAPETTLPRRLRNDERALEVVTRAKFLLHGMTDIRTDGSFRVRPHVLVLAVAILSLHFTGLSNAAAVLFRCVEGDLVIENDQGEDILVLVDWTDNLKEDQSGPVINGIAVYEGRLERHRQVVLSHPPPPLPPAE